MSLPALNHMWSLLLGLSYLIQERRKGTGDYIFLGDTDPEFHTLDYLVSNAGTGSGLVLRILCPGGPRPTFRPAAGNVGPSLKIRRLHLPLSFL